MTLGGEVQHCPRLMLGEDPRNQFRVADVTLDEMVVLPPGDGSDVCRITRIGKLVEVYQGSAPRGEPVQHEIGADETHPSCDQDRPFCLPVLVEAVVQSRSPYPL